MAAYGHLFDDRLAEVGDAIDRARKAAQRRLNNLDLLPRVPQRCPSPFQRGMPKGPLPASLLARTPFRICTPDGIRTRASALRERPRSRCETSETNETAGQSHNC